MKILRRWFLEDGTCKFSKSFYELLLGFNGVMEPDNANVLFSSSLLGLHKSGCTVEANNQAPSYLWIECARVTSFLNF